MSEWADPAGHGGPKEAATRLRAATANLDDLELDTLTSSMMDAAARADRGGRWRIRSWFVAAGLLCQAELVRREEIYDAATAPDPAP